MNLSFERDQLALTFNFREFFTSFTAHHSTIRASLEIQIVKIFLTLIICFTAGLSSSPFKNTRSVSLTAPSTSEMLSLTCWKASVNEIKQKSSIAHKCYVLIAWKNFIHSFTTTMRREKISSDFLISFDIIAPDFKRHRRFLHR